MEKRLAAYAGLIVRWAPTLNLVSRAELAHVRNIHIPECASLARLVRPDVASALDIGSGAGLPGLVLAITTGIPFILVEADGRKAAFLREAIRITDAPATVHANRVEDEVGQVDLVTARALAPLPRLLAWAHPLLRPGGTCLFLKGSRLEQECHEAEKHWQMGVRIHPIGDPTPGERDATRPVPASPTRILEILNLSPRPHNGGHGT